nr:hypothetical protein [Tanacetum cinerariifolium]
MGFDLDASKETKRVKANCILENNLQQASTSGTQSDKAPVYDSNGSAEVHHSENCYDNDIFNMFTQEEQYTELLEPILEPHQVQQNDGNIISAVSSMEQSRGTIEQHPAIFEETDVLYDSLYNNLAIKIEKVNSVNRKLRDTNADLTTELARYKNQEKCFEISQEKYDKLKSEEFSDDTTPSVARKFLNEVLNYAKENAQHKTTYKNLFDFIFVTRTQTKTIIDSLQTKLHDMIYENAKLRAQLFDKVSEQKDTTRGTSANTKFAKQSILGKPPSSSRPKLYDVTPLPKSTDFPKVGETHALLKPVTSNLVPTPTESKDVKNDYVISNRNFRTNPSKTSRVDNVVPNKFVKASVMTKPITVSQPHVITKNDVKSKTNGFSPTDVKNTTRTRIPMSRNNPKNDKAPSKSKSSRLSNNLEKIEENSKNLQSSSNKKHMSSECNNIKLAIRNAKFEVVFAMCKQCLITVNHDVCVLNYVNGVNSHGKKQKVNVSNVANQKKHKAQSWKVYSVICSTNYSNGENQVVSKSSAVTTADVSDKRQQQQQDSTSSTSTLATAITDDRNFDFQNWGDLPRNTPLDRVEVLDCVDDHFDDLDYYSYEDVYGGDCFDVGSSFKGFDWIDEPVGYDDRSLLGKSTDEFSNEVILDAGVSSPTTILSLLLKRKGFLQTSFTMVVPGPSNILARRVTDDLIDFSEPQTARSCIARLAALKAEIEAIGDIDDVFDTLMCLRDEIRDENTKLISLKDAIAQVEDKIAMKEEHVNIMQADSDVV